MVRMPPGASTEGISAGMPDKDKHHSSLIFEGIKYPLVRCPTKEPFTIHFCFSCKTTENKSH